MPQDVSPGVALRQNCESARASTPRLIWLVLAFHVSPVWPPALSSCRCGSRILLPARLPLEPLVRSPLSISGSTLGPTLRFCRPRLPRPSLAPVPWLGGPAREDRASATTTAFARAVPC